MTEKQFNEFRKIKTNSKGDEIACYILYEGSKKIAEVYPANIQSVSEGLLIYRPGTSTMPACIDLSKVTQILTR